MQLLRARHAPDASDARYGHVVYVYTYLRGDNQLGIQWLL